MLFSLRLPPLLHSPGLLRTPLYLFCRVLLVHALLPSPPSFTSLSPGLLSIPFYFFCFPDVAGEGRLDAREGDVLVLFVSFCSFRPPWLTLPRAGIFLCERLIEQEGASGSVVGVGLSARRFDTVLLPPGWNKRPTIN